MATIYTYYLSGYCFETNVYLQELEERQNKSTIGKILLKPQPDETLPRECLQQRYYFNQELNLLTVNHPKLGFIVIKSGNVIEFTPPENKSDAFIRMIILGTVSMFMANLQNFLSLHAACIEINGKAILFCAKSGKGKSSLATHFFSKGYTILSDDVTNIRLEENKLYAYPSVPRIKLSEEGLKNIGLNPDELLEIPSYIKKYSVPLKAQAAQKKYLIAAIYFPEFHDTENEVNPIIGKRKLTEITKHIYRYQIIKQFPYFKHIYPTLFTLISSVEMNHFLRPADKSQMVSSLTFIETHLTKGKL